MQGNRCALVRRLAIVGLAVLMLAAEGRAAEIVVDPKHRFQVMTGWEVTARVMEFDKQNNRFNSSWYQHSDAIFDWLVNETGVNRVRLQIQSNAENPVDYWSKFERGEISYEEVKRNFYYKVNDNGDSDKINPAGFHFSKLDFQVKRILFPIMERAKANGERIYVNLCFVDFDKNETQSRFSHATAPEEYAELIAAAFAHLSSRYGIRPDALEVILEPDNTASWKSGRVIGQAAMAALERLKKTGPAPELILPSTMSAGNAVQYFEQAMQTPGLRPHVDALSYHRYAAGKDATLAQIKQAAERYGVRTEMLEYVQGREQHLHADLTLANASAWQLYSIAGWAVPGAKKLPRSMLIYVDESADGVISDSIQGRTLRQYFRYIRMGAQRIGATSSEPDLQPVAFENRDGGHVVVAIAARAGEIVVRGLPPGDFAASHASRQRPSRPLPVERRAADGALVLQMPGKGVVSIFPAAMARH